MSSIVSLEAEELHAFSLPHAFRLAGEHLHVIGSGAVAVATNLRLWAEAEESPNRFSVALAGGRSGKDDAEAAAREAARMTERWRDALGCAVGADPSDLEGLQVRVDFGPLREVCPASTLLGSPALAVALTVAVIAHRGDGRPVTAPEVAARAGAAHARAGGLDERAGDRVYSEALMSLLGGIGYVEPGGNRLNLQELLPPASLILALVQSPEAGGGPAGRDAEAREILATIAGSSTQALARGDEGLSALFGLPEGTLDEGQTAMAYALFRVREMTEEFVEMLDEPVVDNDRLAEICDEESEILADYFGFPAAPYARIRALAAEAGALGTKLTWGFGGHPCALIMAPGRRQGVLDALRGGEPEAHFLPVDMDPTGLLRGDAGPDRLGPEG